MDEKRFTGTRDGAAGDVPTTDPPGHRARISADPLAEAFPSRRPLMPWSTLLPASAPEAEADWRALRRSPAQPRPRVAYIHVPFCHSRCTFCGFFENRYRGAASAPYVDAVLTEMAREAQDLRLQARTLRALYLGGGTPTALEPRDLGRLVEGARSLLPLANDCEITLEGRLAHFDGNRIDAALDAGVNRISLGVQTFDTTIRRRLGRICSRAELLRSLSRLAARDRATLVVDLICGLPGQTDATWCEDVQTCIDLGLDGVDLYTLAVFPGTPLHRAASNGRHPAPAPLAVRARRYGLAVHRLAQAGWTQLSNSHFGTGPRERSLYNIAVKQGAETFAYGAGAGGSLGNLVFRNTTTLADYLESVDGGAKPVASWAHADCLQRARDVVLGDLERGCVIPARMRRSLPDWAPVDAPLDDMLRQWESAGLLALDGGVARLSVAGRFWSSNLAQGLYALLAEAFPEAARSPAPRPSPGAVVAA